ncbi:ABC transporter permease [Pigmentiphaga litoralis]|uniref:Phospholipid/cholesterol/gamma-HCH transport system permease protein n=1 Tax=Pigmentiphaga litoralis TaxID=516702 RepID=A0A7Y9LMT0_9BURK|nr:ABC transporter permease [Pigmentiphaga litoralis]NYE22428.1 phospholipid/cholesterol/gamma-HCH transport system permease protein [Pigmentiphaga litoralis]NYE83957.1 phospholipid/cholesterol/gamma-HCH transport system permease protein [Pigmentiphaga litoralis]
MNAQPLPAVATHDAPSANDTFLTVDTSASPPRLRLSGDWTLAHYQVLLRLARKHSFAGQAAPHVDLSGIGALDTAGASAIVELLGPHLLDLVSQPDALATQGLAPNRQALLRTVAEAMCTRCRAAPVPPTSALMDVIEHIGRAMARCWQLAAYLLGFIGLTLEALARNLFRPRRWRVTAVVAQIEQTGLDAVPIVALLTFMVGAVIAFLGATVLDAFGASIYTVDLVAFAFLREFAVLLTAILMAGRTASAFTAQIGSMKANEEIDAIRALGMNPVDLLVLPRVLALLISLPALTFIAMIAGITGGAIVCALSLDISPSMFLSILHQNLEARHFLLGMAKAPIFAFLIAIVGCLEGFKVSGSAQSVGEHTTSAVVQCIFIVILVDAVAALFYMEMGW